MEKLTVRALEGIKPGAIFAQGESIDNEDGLHMSGSGELLKWVAIRGYTCDWAVYAHYAEFDYAWIRRHGDKVQMDGSIKKLVECSDEALQLYRH